jgi:hypothetical protein
MQKTLLKTKGHFIMIKGPMHEEDKPYAPSNITLQSKNGLN